MDLSPEANRGREKKEKKNSYIQQPLAAIVNKTIALKIQQKLIIFIYQIYLNLICQNKIRNLICFLADQNTLKVT